MAKLDESAADSPFAEREIEELVDEVEETGGWEDAAASVSLAPPAPSLAVAEAPAFEIDHHLDPDWQESGRDATPAPAMHEPTTEHDAWDLGDPEQEESAYRSRDDAERQPELQAAPTDTRATSAFGDAFSFDDGEAPADRYASDRAEAGPERFGARNPEAPPTEPALTDALADRELFEDPSLDVARMSTGEEREIVVPVEIASGPLTRRFKLCVRLRLDPVD
jgi:hypothetical protein